MRPITLYRSDRLRVRLAAFLDISRTALRAVAPIVDLLVRLSLAKAFFAPGMLPGGDLGDFHATWPIIAAQVTGPVLLAAGFLVRPLALLMLVLTLLAQSLRSAARRAPVLGRSVRLVCRAGCRAAVARSYSWQRLGAQPPASSRPGNGGSTLG